MPNPRALRTGVQTTGLPVLALGTILIAVAAIYRGSNRWLPLTLIESLSLALLVVLASTWIFARSEAASNVRGASTWRPYALGVVLTSPLWLAALQLVPLPLSWARAPSIGHLLPGLEIVGSTSSLSLLPDETWRSALAGLPIMCCFALALAVPHRGMEVMLRVWLGTAVVQAILGLVQLVTPELAFSEVAIQTAQGSFGSRNSLGNYLAMMLPVALVLTLSSAKHGNNRHKKQPWSRWLWASVLLLLLAALMASTSRGGIATGVLVLLLTLALIPAHSTTRRGSASGPSLQKWLIRLLPLGLLAFAMASGGWSWLARFETGDASRLLNWAAAWEGVQAFWPLGSGLGTFSAVFPYFQPPELGVYFVNFAHNDYLQLLMECGVLVLPPALALGWLVARRCMQLVRVRRIRPWTANDALAVACGLGFLAQALHAWVDYPWRIPATAMLGAFMLGVFLREPRESVETGPSLKM